MHMQALARLAACTTALCLLAGCAPQTTVKDVLANPQYVAAKFAADTLPAPVRAAITHADPGPLGFHTLRLTLDWTINPGNQPGTYTTQQNLALSNSGASFVQASSTVLRNGVPVSKQYQLTYRNLLSLRTQSVKLDAATAGLIVTPVAVKHFDAVTNAATTLSYANRLGIDGGVAGIWGKFNRSRTCTVGSAYPASRVFAAFPGAARDITCTDFNDNGVKTATADYAYLEAYGVAVELHLNAARGHADAKIVAASVNGHAGAPPAATPPPATTHS